MGYFFYNKLLLIIMNGELDYDDIFYFFEEIVVEKINDFYLVIVV